MKNRLSFVKEDIPPYVGAGRWSGDVTVGYSGI